VITVSLNKPRKCSGYSPSITYRIVSNWRSGFNPTAPLLHRARIFKLFRSPDIDSTESTPCENPCARFFKQCMGAKNRVGIGLSYWPARAGIFKKSMGARNRWGIGLSYRPARLHGLAEFIPWNQFRGPHKHLQVQAHRLLRLAELIPWNRLLGSVKVEKFGLWFRRGIDLREGVWRTRERSWFQL
jgi:hypothetical protein